MATIPAKGWILLSTSAALGVALALSRCFSPELPTCSYICNKTEPRCPEQYECRDDCYCHLKGSVEACDFPQDMNGCDLASPPPDLAAPRPDQASPPDQATGDLAGTD